MALITSKLNVKNSATAGERKVTGGLEAKHNAHMRHELHMPKYEYASDKNPIKDYGNFCSQIHTGK